MPTSGWWADETASSSDDSEVAAPVFHEKKDEYQQHGEACKFFYGSMYGNVVHAVSGRTMPEKASSKESLKYYCVMMNEGCALGLGNTMKDAVRCYFYNPQEYERFTGNKLSAAQVQKWQAQTLAFQ
jgi:hypothetical protein